MRFYGKLGATMVGEEWGKYHLEGEALSQLAEHAPLMSAAEPANFQQK